MNRWVPMNHTAPRLLLRYDELILFSSSHRPCCVDEYYYSIRSNMNHLWREPLNWWTTCWTAKKRTVCDRWSWTDCDAMSGWRCCCCDHLLCWSVSRTWPHDPIRPIYWPTRRYTVELVADYPQPPMSGSVPAESSVARTWFLLLPNLNVISNRYKKYSNQSNHIIDPS